MWGRRDLGLGGSSAGPMISNDEVASSVAAEADAWSGRQRRYPATDGSGARDPALHPHAGFPGDSHPALAVEVPPTDRRFHPIYAECCEAGRASCTQIGHTGSLMPSEVGRPIYLGSGGDRFSRAGDRWRPHRLPLDRRGRSAATSTRTSTSIPRRTPRRAIRRRWSNICADTDARRSCSSNYPDDFAEKR